MATRTTTIDSQVHAFERNRPERPWIGFLTGPDEVTGGDMVAAMDAVGVDGAVLVSPFSLYRYDPSYILEVYATHPGRFGLIKPFDPRSKTVADEIAEWAGTPGVVGARMMLTAQEFEADDPGLNRILDAVAKAGIPVNVMCSGKLPLFRELARRHPDTRMVVDHVGLIQPFEPPVPPEPFGDLANVLSLAAYDNVAIKISGACTLSHQPFPYPDIWEPLGKVFDAFGLDRCMWGTDWTRAVEFLTYEQGVEAFRVTDRLSESERSTLMGGTLAKIYNWSPETGG
ncbi:MAG: amidohydrolase family protein [Dehalococcoidia bacterium]|nr:amidohydrolase family protein [Dehalococcoidia bacterium]MDP7083046.1 amidohydrolase family protein [Dehalococcoidia bacterium]HJN88082.1 amidohydrolase family protein [Dehalococcoidia bacterium]